MSEYVAMGSSFAAGPGIRPIIDRGALRSAANYPHLVAATCSLDLTDVTCSGATSAHILTKGQHTLGSTRPLQIDAVTPATKLVTVTVGGNDIGYIGALTWVSSRQALRRKLRRGPDSAAARGSASCPPREKLETLTQALTDVANSVRRTAPQARVIFVDYLTMLGTHPVRSSLVPESEQQAVRDTAAALEGAFAAAAARSDSELVVASLASRDHGLDSPEPWVFGLEFGWPWTGGVIPFHPNGAGMAAVAQLVTEQIRRPTA